MDWSKAKSVLIVSFIIINLILGYVIFVGDKGTDPTLSVEFIEDAIRLLNNKEIFLDTEIPKENPGLLSLIVEYETIKARELNKNYFNDKGGIVFNDEDLVEISMDDETLTIINRKLVIYQSNNIDEIYHIGSEKEALDLASKFLVEKGYDTDDMVLSHIQKVDKEYYIEYSKVYDDIFLESAFTNIQIGKNGVRKLERMWLDVKDVGENIIYISTAPKSILGLLSMEEAYGKTIMDISLCYYFEPEKHDYIENPEMAKQGRTIPAWRIQFNDGYKVFLDNY